MTTTSPLNLIQPTKVNLFTVSVAQFEVSEWAGKKDVILDMIPSSNDAEEHISFTDYFDNTDAGYKGYIFNLVEPYLKAFYDTALYKFKGITNMWCQRYKARDYHVPHDHGAIGYSCVFYAKMSEEHRSTLFFSPFNDETGTHPSNSLMCKEGDLVIFPSNLMHMAPPHDSEDERVIISFNLQ